MKDTGDLTILELRKKNWGLTDAVLAKLLEAFSFDYTIDEACAYVCISTNTFCRWNRQSSEFRDRMTNAKSFMGMTAKANLYRAIKRDGSVPDSWEYLKRRQKEIYSDRQELTGKNGDTLELNIFNILVAIQKNEPKTIEGMQAIPADSEENT